MKRLTHLGSGVCIALPKARMISARGECNLIYRAEAPTDTFAKAAKDGRAIQMRGGLMTHGVVTHIRTVIAFAIGVCIDLILFADAYPYGERYQHQSLFGISIFCLGPLLAFLCSFALDFKRRDPRGESPDPGWIAKFDTLALLIPSAIVIGVTITHTIVLIRDVTIDPTTHNLLPFEYIFMWIAVGVPAVAGSMLARAIFWVFNRFRVQ